MIEEEAVAVVGIGGLGGGGGGEERGEGGGGEGVVEEILADEEVGGVEAEWRVHVEGRPAQPHHPKRQRVRSSSSTLTHLSLFSVLSNAAMLNLVMILLLFSKLQLHTQGSESDHNLFFFSFFFGSSVMACVCGQVMGVHPLHLRVQWAKPKTSSAAFRIWADKNGLHCMDHGAVYSLCFSYFCHILSLFICGIFRFLLI